MKKLKIITLGLLSASTITCASILVANNQSVRVRANNGNEVWSHYAERMPSALPGIREYWVSCSSHETVFSEPLDGDVEEKTTWDTTGFEENDERYTEVCPVVVADSALDGATVDSAPYTPTFGFTHVTSKNPSANEANGYKLDISNYKYLSFGLYVESGKSLVMFGGTGGPDNYADSIAANQNVTLFGGKWYYFVIEKNDSGEWDAYMGDAGWKLPKRQPGSLKMAASAKSATNLNALVYYYNWSGATKVYSTEVVAYSPNNEYYTLGSNSKHGAYWTSEDGATVKNCGYNGTALNYDPSGTVAKWKVYLPEVDYRAFKSVTFEIAASASYAGFGFVSNNLVYNSAAAITGTLFVENNDGTFNATITSNNGNRTATITDNNVLDGLAPLMIYYENQAAYRQFLVKSVTVDCSINESEVRDASITEVNVSKIKRCEQTSAEYIRFGMRDAIHFSAHYTDPASDEYIANGETSEWRFMHTISGLTSITLDYLYVDSNSDTTTGAYPDLGALHTFAQWHTTAYEGRLMNLTADGIWHTITITGAASNIDFFVMKIYHFTGDIYVSNIIYA